MQRIYKTLFFMFLAVVILFPIYYIFITSDTLIYEKYFDLYLYYLASISLVFELFAIMYVIYRLCYINKCVNFYAYVKSEKKSFKDIHILGKIFIVPISFVIMIFLPFLICFLFLFILLESYLHVYALFNSQKSYEYMYMDYATSSFHRSSSFAVATPDKKYKLHGHLNAIGFDINDEDKTPYIVMKNSDSLYIKKGHLYKLWTKKNKYGYIIDDYVRIIGAEYTEQKLKKLGCIKYHGDFTCKGTKLEEKVLAK